MKRVLLATTCLVFATSAEAFNLNIDKSFAQAENWVIGSNNSNNRINGCLARALYSDAKKTPIDQVEIARIAQAFTITIECKNLHRRWQSYENVSP